MSKGFKENVTEEVKVILDKLIITPLFLHSCCHYLYLSISPAGHCLNLFDFPGMKM